jgi:pantoate--beta-alanine ligase
VKIVRTHAACRAVVDAARRLGKTVGFVPTMGALHVGHIALVKRARAECGFVAASVFVNPSQFGRGEDLSRYPRSAARDRRLLAAHGCDLLYAPSVRTMYPGSFSTWIEPPDVARRWEGEHRPTHFRGVCTVVLKLLCSVDPDRAYFGEKDYQQLRTVEAMCRDLNVRAKIVGVPTVRESDGLACSSRNAYLSPANRRRAAAVPRALAEARRAVRSGAKSPRAVERKMRAVLIGSGARRIDYAAVVDPRTLQPAKSLSRPTRAIIAVVFGRTRLIDNASLPRSGK